MTVAAAAAAVIVSCKKEPLPDEGGGQTREKLQFASEYPALAGSDEKCWKAGGRIAVASVTSNVWGGSFGISDKLEEDCETAEFSVTLDCEVSTKTRFHAIFPADCIVSPASELPAVQIVLPSGQTPDFTGDGGSTGAGSGLLDRSADILNGHSEKDAEGNSKIVWERPLARLDLNLKSLNCSAGEKLRTISLTADASICGKASIDIVSGRMNVSEGNKTVVADISALELDASGEIRLCLPLFPTGIRTIELEITTDKKTYRKKESRQINLLGGRRAPYTMDLSDAVSVDGGDADETDPEKEAMVNRRIFELLDLNLPGMEQVKKEYGAGHQYAAAEALKAYWRSGRTVVNPDVDLNLSKCPDSDLHIANQALRENGYRFYVKNYYESIDPVTGRHIYYSFMGSDGKIDWNILPTTERQFALQKHRHQWIESQCKAYWTGKDEKYVKAIEEVYTDFLRTFPCPVAGQDSYAIPAKHELRDIWTDLQATSRTLTYINFLDWCIGSESLSPEYLTHLLVSLYDTVECIRANLYHTAASNHRLFEVQAVYYASVLLPEMAASKDWEKDSYDAISEQLDIQFASDGVQNEMDPSYHISVIATFYSMYNLALANNLGNRMPEGYVERLKNACFFVRDIIYPDYSIENFNDTRSSGWTPRVLQRNFDRYYSLFPEEDTFRWMATAGASGTSPAGTYQSYPHSGWHIFRSGWKKESSMLILKNNWNDHGWWHCQPDNGTVSLYRNGRNFLPDAGVFSYGGSASDDAIREEFRSTAMHNTISLEGQTLTTMLGKCVQEDHTAEYDMAKVSNASYSNLSHERTVFHLKSDDIYVVVDRANGNAAGKTINLHWHFCPGKINYARKNDSYSCSTAFGDGNDMHFRTFCFNGTALSTTFKATTGTSWTSDSIGRKTERSCCTVGVTKGSADVRFVTVIVPVSDPGSLPEINIEFNGTSSLVAEIDGKQYNLDL